ncbi:MAG: hypothetical protein PVI23_04095 [Maricaulaceae bacterium]|jgi:hypothetical protein
MRYVSEELETFLEQEPALLAEYEGRWVVISGREVVGIFESYQAATELAVTDYQHGSFLIRRIGGTPAETTKAAVA